MEIINYEYVYIIKEIVYRMQKNGFWVTWENNFYFILLPMMSQSWPYWAQLGNIKTINKGTEYAALSAYNVPTSDKSLSTRGERIASFDKWKTIQLNLI